MGITRQAVMSLIKRTENILLNYENKLGFAKRLGRMKECFGNIAALAENINDTNLRLSVLAEIEKGLEIL